MAKGGPWDDGRRAWERLVAWHQRHGDDGDAALTALADIGAVRRLLEQAELEAVRAARGAGRAWAEIATGLGITRQSAWEKWRDLDETRVTRPESVIARAADETVGRATRRARLESASLSVVPDVVGLSWDDARLVLLDARLVAVGPDPDGPPLAALGWPGGVVVAQDPKPGVALPHGSPVTVWIERGGGAGDREPRRPGPMPKRAVDIPDELAEDVLGG